MSVLRSSLITCSLVLGSSLILSACSGSDSSSSSPENFQTKAELGEALFSDKNLSNDRTQSCASCHDPDHAFIDPRTIAEVDGRLGNAQQQNNISPVSLGDDQSSIGDRNAPTAAYARFSPMFTTSATRQRFNSQQPNYTGARGGQFHDGREANLKGQAGGPPLNPVEMDMADKAAVVARLQENDKYVRSFESLYSAKIFDDTDAAYAAMAESIAEFEKTDAFSSFDSFYDRSLRGEVEYPILSKAGRGKALFFSQQFTNCATCHQLKPNNNQEETFTGYEYHNIGVPLNTAVSDITGNLTDDGLLANPAITDTAQRGKYKTPTLRNVAVTAPYMHNGVFNKLDTVIRFYDHFITGSINTTNPETGQAWRAAKVPGTVSLTELQDGRLLSKEVDVNGQTVVNDDDVEALVCFMRSLTDKRYEHLIPDDGLDCYSE